MKNKFQLIFNIVFVFFLTIILLTNVNNVVDNFKRQNETDSIFKYKTELDIKCLQEDIEKIRLDIIINKKELGFNIEEDIKEYKIDYNIDTTLEIEKTVKPKKVKTKVIKKTVKKQNENIYDGREQLKKDLLGKLTDYYHENKEKHLIGNETAVMIVFEFKKYPEGTMRHEDLLEVYNDNDRTKEMFQVIEFKTNNGINWGSINSRFCLRRADNFRKIVTNDINKSIKEGTSFFN